MTRLLFAAALALLAACGSTPETPPPVNGAKDKSPLKFELVAAKLEFKVGEAIDLRARLTNTSDAPVLANTAFRANSEQAPAAWREIVFTILNEKGERLPFMAAVRPSTKHDMFTLLAAGQSAEGTVPLDRLYELDKPGKYLIQATYENVQDPQPNTWGRAAFKGKAHSNTVAIKIVP